MNNRDPNHLHPDLRPLYDRWLAQCENQGLKVFPVFIWRSVAEQDALYAEGRTVRSTVGPWTDDKPLGSIVTNARGGQSPHNFTLPDGTPASKAFDFGVLDDDGHYIADGQDTRYTKAAMIGEDLGITWGGRFKSIPDYDHLQLADFAAAPLGGNPA